jgi:transcriptional regulator with XRE-family HTH domain
MIWYQMELATAIRELRTRIGESQQIFATKLGISIRALANYENFQQPPRQVLDAMYSLAKEKGFQDLAQVMHEAAMARMSLRELLSSGGRKLSFGTSRNGEKILDWLVLSTDGEEERKLIFCLLGLFSEIKTPETQQHTLGALERVTEELREINRKETEPKPQTIEKSPSARRKPR